MLAGRIGSAYLGDLGLPCGAWGLEVSPLVSPLVAT